MQLVNKMDFVEAILNHKTGFLVSTGDAAGERNEAFSINSVFFDTSYMLNGSNRLLAFDNKLDFTEVDGICTESIYSMGNILLDTDAIVSVREYDGDYLSDTFAVGVQRVFEIEIKDEAFQTNSLFCIGLL